MDLPKPPPSTVPTSGADADAGTVLGEELLAIIREDERVFRKLQEAAVDATFVWDLTDPTRQYVSPRFWSILGYDTPGSIPEGSNWQSVANRRDVRKFLAAVERHVDCSDEEINVRMRLRHANGYEIVTETFALAVCRDSETANRIVGIHKDLSRERQLEILLNETNTAARIGAWSWDVATGEIYWSPVTRLIHEIEDPDYEPALETGIDFYREGYSRERIRVVIGECLAEGKPWDELFEIVTAKGEFRWVRAIGHAERYRGKAVRILGSFQDVHEQRLRDIELAKNEALLSNSFKLAPNGMVIADAAGVIERASASFARMIGYDQVDIVGKPFIDFTYAEDRRLDEEMFRAFENVERGQVRLEKRVQTAAGHVLWADVGVAVIRDEQGAISNYLAQILDITAAKSEEAYRVHLAFLEDKAREMEQFAYIASHDLRQPVLTLKGYLDALREDYDDQLDEQGLQYVGIMESAVERMDAMIRGLLDYSRLSKSRQLAEVDLDDVIDGVLQNVEALRLQTKASISVAPLPKVYGLAVELTQVFQNLLNNALRYHRPGVPPEIGITSRPIQGGHEFCVSDNGIGISQSDQERIFGLFQRVGQQAHDTTGSGIGLASCRTIIERHGGTISVASTLGVGSRFCFTIMTEQFQ